MENKKPLIIVQPMSAPMQKLKEVLEGVAVEENIEIYIVDDAKEFNQLIGSGGQCLVMISNAKLAATLLQDNKVLIAKNHTKVILLTPKEIPQKTLVKFTKIGLTEAILESSPPKTLLYKVKLLLRSIKITQKEENAPKVVKSMLDMNTGLNSNEEIAQDSQHVGIIEKDSSEETENAQKKVDIDSDDNTLDYLSNMKGKKNSTDEAIETHWKGKKDRSTTAQEEENDKNLKTQSDSREDEIDMFYRGKQKKKEIQLEIEPALGPKVKINEDEEENTSELYQKKKEEDEELASDLERRKKIIYDDEDEKDFIQKAKEKEIELNLEKEKKINNEDTEEGLDDINDKLLAEIEEDEKKRKAFQEEDLGGHLKGKLKRETQEDESSITNEKNRQDEEVEAESKKKKNHDEEEEEADLRQKKESTSENEEELAQDGEVDIIDNFMRGDLETTEAIKTRMEAQSDSNKKKKNEEEEEELEDQRRTKLEETKEEENSKEADSDLVEETGKSKKADLDEENIEENDFSKKNKLANENEEDPFGKIDLKKDDEESKSAKNRTQKSKEEELDENRKKLSLEEEDKLQNKKKSLANLDLEPGKNGLSRDGKTEKISTFYRSGENGKKDQDWDINNQKNDTTIELEHGKKDTHSIDSFKKRKDAGEVTIDYKKLKAEFDLISRGENAEGIEGHSGHGPLNNGLEIDDDSFQVIELGSISLDFAVETINMYYAQEVKPITIIKSVAEKILKDENAYLIAYFYKDSKYTEVLNSYYEFKAQIPENVIADWNEISQNETNKQLFHSFSMPTWLCRSIPDKNDFWRDIELPTWANKELTDKKVEFIYPFFDGVDRVGYIHLYFPQGINPANDKKILLIIEMLRGIFLENAPRRHKNEPSKDLTPETESIENKGKILNFFGGMFGKKKVG